MKIKNKISYIKYYLKILFDFSKLNKYIFLSSKLINRIELILKSDLDNTTKIDNIIISYNDFKIDYDFEEFNEKVSIENNFDRKE